ncbi:hypothetical protein HMPREF9061_00236 [Actinomyces sp. oral taxon 181 str. F0379]|nr:hypothetical protein HMPREF9061_00236 [Actinomyces sp. oral taxon 181 str. F0379]
MRNDEIQLVIAHFLSTGYTPSPCFPQIQACSCIQMSFKEIVVYGDIP